MVLSLALRSRDARLSRERRVVGAWMEEFEEASEMVEAVMDVLLEVEADPDVGAECRWLWEEDLVKKPMVREGSRGGNVGTV